MARRFSIGAIIFGSINILVAVIPPCAGVFGAAFFLQEPSLPIKGRDLGPQFKKHIDQELPAAKAEAIGAAACNAFVFVLLAVGGVGLIFNQTWARWLSIAAAILLILTLCIHDIYQLAVFRPSINDFLDRNLPPGGPPGEREGFKFGFSLSFFFWSCSNPLIMLYLVAMCIYVGLTFAHSYPEAVDGPQRRSSRRRSRYGDEDD
jgi:hypothetical protein